MKHRGLKRGSFHVDDLVLVSPRREKAYPFKPGDHARLRSGGPSMLVTHIDGSEVACSWGDQSAWFPAICLDPVDN